MTPSSDSPRRATTRRSILRWSGVGIIATVTGFFGWRRAQDFMRTAMPRKETAASGPPQGEKLPSAYPPAGISREAFVPYLESEFRLEAGPLTTKNIKLVDVSAAQKLRSKTAEFTAFSLLFAAPKKFEAESRVYHLVHEQMGAMDLFLSPVGRSKEHVHLEAVFSQRV